MTFHNKDISEILQTFNTSENGLSSLAVQKNRELFGSNEPEKQKSTGFLKKFFLQFKNIMIVILLISATLSITMALASHDYQNLFHNCGVV